MKPIQFVRYRDRVWYNLTDYIRLLTEANTLWAVRPAARGRRDHLPKTPHQAVHKKLPRLKPIYQLKVNQEVYVDWFVFEHLYGSLKPFLIQSTDSRNPGCIVRKIHGFIDQRNRVAAFPDDYCKELLTDSVSPQA